MLSKLFNGILRGTDNTLIGNLGDKLKTIIVDPTTNLPVSVVLDGGVNKLRALADVTVNSLRGFDPIADTWFFIGTEGNSTGVGGAGDTVRVQIAAGDNPTLFPAVDVTTVVQAGDTEPVLAARIVTNLNGDTNFALNFFARVVDGPASTVYITAKAAGPSGERPNVDDFQVTTTGTTVATRAFQNIIRRQKNTSLARDPANPTLGVLGISGTVQAGAGEVTGRIVEFAKNGASPNLLVNGSVTPVDFTIGASATKQRFITSIRFEALGNGMQFTKFLSQNGVLTNGVLLTVRSNNAQIDFPAITATEDFASYFGLGPQNFDFYDVSGTDYFRATLTFEAPFQIYKQGTFATNDFIRVRIRDNLTSGIQRFQCIAFGFERDF